MNKREIEKAEEALKIQISLGIVNYDDFHVAYVLGNKKAQKAYPKTYKRLKEKEKR